MARRLLCMDGIKINPTILAIKTNLNSLYVSRLHDDVEVMSVNASLPGSLALTAGVRAVCRGLA